MLFECKFTKKSETLKHEHWWECQYENIFSFWVHPEILRLHPSRDAWNIEEVKFLVQLDKPGALDYLVLQNEMESIVFVVGIRKSYRLIETLDMAIM